MNDQSNVAIVKRIYELFAKGDRDGMRSLLAVDFDWEYFGPSSVPWAGKYRGHSGFDRFFAIVRDFIEVEHFDVREYIDAGDRVVVLGTSQARVLASGARYETQWINIFTVVQGRITRLLDLYETASVVRALETSSIEKPRKGVRQR